MMLSTTSTTSAQDVAAYGANKKRAHANHDHRFASLSRKKLAPLKEEGGAQEQQASQINSDSDNHHTDAETKTIHLLNEKCDAHITDLDTNLQEAISQYIDIYDWGLLKQSCKFLTSWPKPPPPPIDYHLIKFYFSNLSSFGYCGVAKSLPAVVDAYKHAHQLDEDLQDLGEVTIDIQFLHIGDLDSPMLPLVEYDKRKHCKDPTPAQIHRYGRRTRYGIKEAGDEFSAESPARKLMDMELHLYHKEDDQGTVKLLADHGEAAIRWLDGMEPVQDIDLKNLCFADHECQGESAMYEIWLFRDRCGRTVGDYFTLGNCGSWAICDMKADLRMK